MAESDKAGIGQMLNDAMAYHFKKQAEKLQEWERELIEKDLHGDLKLFDGFHSLIEKDIKQKTTKERPKEPWGSGEPLTMEELNAMFKKVCKEHLRYTYSICIGFVDNRAIDDNTVWIVKYDAFQQNGKSIVLTKTGSNLHKLIRQIENEEDIRFDRLTDDTMRAIQQKCKILFTDEDGRFKSLLEPIDPVKIAQNPLTPDDEVMKADYLCMGAEMRLIDLIND